MSHEVETMAYAGEVPWHGLGVRVPADLSPEQMLVKAGLDWTVDKLPLFTVVNDNKYPVPNKRALIRSSDDTILDIVTDSWNPVQNQDAFEFFDEYCRAGDMEMHTAGSLKGGQIVWALAKVKESFELFKGDEVESYLLLTNPHKFGQSIDVRFTPIRVVCNNTLTLSLNSHSVNYVKVNHSTKFNADQVKEALGIATDKLAKYKEMAAFLGSKRYTQESMQQYFNDLFPTYSKKEGKEVSRNAQKAASIIETQPGSKFAEGTWWQPFNAVTFLLDHVIGRNNETRIASSWYGLNKSVKVQALEKAVEYAEAA